MLRIKKLYLSLCGICALPLSVQAGELSGSASLASQYIYRGQALSDGNPAVQLGIDYEHETGVFGGMWSSTVDQHSPFITRYIELDYYLGYHYAASAPVSFSVSLMRYTYPGQQGIYDYDYTEALATVTLLERLSLEYAYTDEVYGFDSIGRHLELRYDQSVASAWVISAGLGSNDLRDLSGSRYLHWDIGASARFSWLTVDLRWYDNEVPEGFIGRLSAGSELVVTLTGAF